MASKRQLQVAELIKRFFGSVLMEEGYRIFGSGPMVSVTSVQVTPDLSLARIFLSIFNSENKNETLNQIIRYHHVLKQSLAGKVRKHIRRMPELEFFIDDTLDEMYRLDELFDHLKKK
ncbi:MAG TPA: 30S ribosome-binding factor RbfA [Saprospiraceae bacterium]|nr:30S ribosome-binding factor RbfA [Saprospiraceae bacterium]